TPYHAGPGGHMGAFIAWDAARGRTVWAIKEPYPVWSGVLATAGNVVFYGTLDGWFKAADATTGRPLWKFKVGSGVVGNPIAYTGPDGKQYVAVYAGIGGDWFLLAGIAGAMVGVPVPIVGSVIGAFTGAFVGAALFEYSVSRTPGVAVRAGWGAVLGRAAGAAAKIALGVVIAVIGGFAAAKG